MLDCTISDFLKTGHSFKLFKINNWTISSGLSNYGGKLEYAYIKFSDNENDALGRVVLFSIYDGKQLVFADTLNNPKDLTPGVLNAAYNMFKFMKESDVPFWTSCISKINSYYNGVNGFKPISLDLPVPTLTLYTPIKENIEEV